MLRLLISACYSLYSCRQLLTVPIEMLSPRSRLRRVPINTLFYALLAVHLDAILGNEQLDALFLNVFILRLYMFRAASAHHQEG
jgi:hypothetical protein